MKQPVLELMAIHLYGEVSENSWGSRCVGHREVK